MEGIAISRSTAAAEPRCDPATRLTRSLLGYGVVAGPFYVAVALVQAALRPGFDITRHDVSLLANGDFGWVQSSNFVLTGLMVVASAVGLGRALAGGRAATAAPILLAGFGIGLVAAGIFAADPMSGFPAGAPSGMPTTISAHGLLHIAAAGLGFASFAGACLALGRRFAGQSNRAWAAFSILTGALFLVAFAGLASGSGSQAVVLGFWAALILAWTWLAALATRSYRRLGRGLPA